MTRKLPALAAAITAAILGAGGLTLAAGAATAQASPRLAATSTPSASPDFTCPSGVTCFFSNNDYTGSVFEENNQGEGGNVLREFSDLGITPNPGSAHINGN